MAGSPFDTTLSGAAVPITKLLSLLQGQSDRRIVNKTNLLALFDFTFSTHDYGTNGSVRIGMILHVSLLDRTNLDGILSHVAILHSQDNSSSRVSRVSPAIRLLSAVMMASASSRLVFCSAMTFSSTVSRATNR
jgi:hypothetical protein